MPHNMPTETSDGSGRDSDRDGCGAFGGVSMSYRFVFPTRAAGSGLPCSASFLMGGAASLRCPLTSGRSALLTASGRRGLRVTDGHAITTTTRGAGAITHTACFSPQQRGEPPRSRSASQPAAATIFRKTHALLCSPWPVPISRVTSSGNWNRVGGRDGGHRVSAPGAAPATS